MPSQADIVATPKAPPAVGPYSQAVRAGNLIFTAGQIPLSPATGQLVSADISQQTAQVMENIKHILEAAGSSLEQIVKTTLYVTDLADFGAINQVYATFFVGKPPARSTVQVAGLPLGAKIEIEAVATLTQDDLRP